MILDAESLEQLGTIVRRRSTYYSLVRRHASLGAGRPWLSFGNSTAKAEQHNSSRDQMSNCCGSLHCPASRAFPDQHGRLRIENVEGLPCCSRASPLLLRSQPLGN